MSSTGGSTIDRPTLIIRPLTADDLAAVQRIEESASPDPWSAALFADELAGNRSDRHWSVATVDGAVVGFGGLMFVADEAHIMNLAVDPARHRQGIASRLVADLLLTAGDRGSVAATLEVRVSNQPALMLYRRFGFEQAGRRPRYYPDGEDAAIMWVHRIYDRDYRSRLEEQAIGSRPSGRADR
ncbi:MAG: ribosomal protein S18-alanine N-acetyltransferase [Acidimicrobiales bacterium]